VIGRGVGAITENDVNLAIASDAVVIGSGAIDGRPVLVAAEDFTVKAGTISQPANSKRYRVAELAVLDRAGLPATVRLTRGRDIAAACGQLAATTAA